MFQGLNVKMDVGDDWFSGLLVVLLGGFLGGSPVFKETYALYFFVWCGFVVRVAGKGCGLL
jgi:hypothetical protein